jgi:two-component system chemotaxis response regulator CheB
VRSINPEGLVRDVIVVGASAGGIRAVGEVISGFPAEFSGFIGIVIHRGDRSRSDWSDILGRTTRLRVVEPRDGELLARGTAYVAPSDRHMTFTAGSITLDYGPKEHRTRPAIDPLFRSVAVNFGTRVVGVVLTGGGTDGTEGVVAISRAGGISLAQRASEADVTSMPESAIHGDHIRAVLPLAEMSDTLLRLARGEAGQG